LKIGGLVSRAMSLEASFEAPEAEAEADVPEAPEAELLLELLSASPQWPAAGVSFLRRPSIKRSTDWRLNELFSCLPVDCAWPVAVADMLHLDGAMQRKCIEKWEPLEDGDGQALGAFGVFTPWGKRRVSEVGWGEFIGDSSDFEEHAAHYEAVFQNHKDLTAEQKLLALNSIEKARQALQPGHVTTDDGRRGRADASKRKRTASPSGPASKRAVKGRDCKVDKAGCKVEEPGPVDSKASAAAAASAASLPFEVRDRCWAKFELFMGQEWFGGYVVRARTEKRYDVVFDDACIMRDVDHAVLKRKPPKTKTLKLDGPNAAALLELEKFEINFDDDFVFEEDVFEDAEAPVVSTDGEEAEEVAETDDGEYVDLRLSLKDAMLLRDALPSRPKQQTRHVSAPLYVESKGVSALRRGWWAAEDPRRSQPGGILDDSVFSKGPTFLTEQGFKRVRDQIRLVLELRNDSFFLRNTFRAPLRVEAVPDSDVRTGLRGQRRAVATRGLQKLQLLGIYGGALLLEEEHKTRVDSPGLPGDLRKTVFSVGPWGDLRKTVGLSRDRIVGGIRPVRLAVSPPGL